MTALYLGRGLTIIMVVSLLYSATSSAADIQNGHTLFNKHCVICHTHIQGLMDKSGPNLHGLFNRQAGTANYLFGYSELVAQSGIKWVGPTLDLFLTAPARMMPGTKMVFRGLDDSQDRADLICYLQHATNTGEQLISSDCEQ